MEIGLIGSGALASLFAVRLAPHTPLTMLGHWSEQARVVTAQGLTLHESSGPAATAEVPVVTAAAKMPTLDVALVLVKSWQTERAARELAAILGANGVAVTLQNGLGSAALLAGTLGSGRVVQGVTAQGATMLAAGHVRHAGSGPTVLERGEHAALVEELAQLLNMAGLETIVAADIQPHVWAKLAVNAAINPLTALLRVRNGFLATNEQARAVMQATAEEAAAVTRALGITLPYQSAGARALEVAQATADNLSSMLQDVLRRAPTEIDAINGAVIAYGQRTGTPVPLNAELRRLMHHAQLGGVWPDASTLPEIQGLLDQMKEVNHDRYRLH